MLITAREMSVLRFLECGMVTGCQKCPLETSSLKALWQLYNMPALWGTYLWHTFFGNCSFVFFFFFPQAVTLLKKSLSFCFILFCVWEATNIQPTGAGGENESMPRGFFQPNLEFPLKLRGKGVLTSPCWIAVKSRPALVPICVGCAQSCLHMDALTAHVQINLSVCWFRGSLFKR